MKNLKDNDPNHRREQANAARQASVERLRAKLRPDSPEMVERAAARRVIAEARDIRHKEREAARKVEEQRKAVEAAARKAADLAAAEERKKAETVNEAQRLIDLKAARDARYAARKKRRK